MYKSQVNFSPLLFIHKWNNDLILTLKSKIRQEGKSNSMID